MKTKPNQLARALHFFKGALNSRALANQSMVVHNKPPKKRMDYETRSTVEEPNVSDGYQRMANGELRRRDHKPREGNGKKLRRAYIKLNRHRFDDFISGARQHLQTLMDAPL